MMGLNYEDIVSKIKDSKGLTDDQVEYKVKEKLNKLSGLISKEGAAHILANELGIDLMASIRRDGLKINKLSPGLRGVTVFGKVVRLYEVRTFNKDGREGKVGSFLVGDDTGFLRVVLWDTNHIQQMEQGKIKEDVIVKVQDGYIKDNQGFKELHLGGQSQIVLNPKNVSITVNQTVPAVDGSAKKKISELQLGDSYVGVTGTIVQVFEPRFYDSCPECNKKVINGTCAGHGAVVAKAVPILNFFFDDGTSNIRCVAFRENVSQLLGVDNETVLKMKEDLSLFDKHKTSVLGSQFNIIGRVTKNDMFDRLEFTVQRIDELDPEKMAAELNKQAS